jgi:hypothetical protein
MRQALILCAVFRAFFRDFETKSVAREADIETLIRLLRLVKHFPETIIVPLTRLSRLPPEDARAPQYVSWSMGKLALVHAGEQSAAFGLFSALIVTVIEKTMTQRGRPKSKNRKLDIIQKMEGAIIILNIRRFRERCCI